MEPPPLDRAKLAVEFYHRHIVDGEALPGSLSGLAGVAAMTAGYAQEKTAAARIFKKI